jgi:hypothetical protein
MKRLEPGDLRSGNILKHYRIIRRWACRNNNLTDADLELLIYFDCMDFFTKQDYKIGTYAYSWDNKRWNNLLKEGWIVVWRNRNRTTQKYNMYKVSFKCRMLINRMYRIMIGEEEIPTSPRSNKIMKGKTYMDTVLIKSINNANKNTDYE